MLSIADKISKGYQIASAIIDTHLDTGVEIPDDIENAVWSHGEGHVQALWKRMNDCRCSLQATMDWDPKHQERVLDRQIEAMEAWKRGKDNSCAT